MTALTKNRTTHARRSSRIGFASLIDVWRQRQRLARLDAHALKDLGLSRTEANAEANRAIWDIPAHWRA